MAAERHHEAHAVTQLGATCGDEREPTGKADAQHPDLAVAGRFVGGEPFGGVLDDVGGTRRNLEALQVRRGHRHHAEAAGRKILRHSDEPRLPNPVHVDARHQGDRPPLTAGGRPIHACVHRAVPRRDLSDGFSDERLGAPCGNLSGIALHAGSARDERERIDVRHREHPGDHEKRADEQPAAHQFSHRPGCYTGEAPHETARRTKVRELPSEGGSHAILFGS